MKRRRRARIQLRSSWTPRKSIDAVYGELRVYWWTGRMPPVESTWLRLALHGHLVLARIKLERERGQEAQG